MIGTGSTISPALGLLLALGQVPADIPEGFATVATFKAQGMSRRRRLLLAASFAIPILLGATLSYVVLRGQAEIYRLGLLAFTAGILLTVAVEEIVVEAHREEDSRLASLFLVGGFALFVALGEFLESRSGEREGGARTGAAVVSLAVSPADSISVARRQRDAQQGGDDAVKLRSQPSVERRTTRSVRRRDVRGESSSVPPGDFHSAMLRGAVTSAPPCPSSAPPQPRRRCARAQ